MIAISENRLRELFDKFQHKKIMVIGDLMLDRYVWGEVTKISPEAPVPVVNVGADSESFRFGGAANVCFNVKTLGAEVVPVGVVGEDDSGRILKELFAEQGLSTTGVIEDSRRPTTVKTRIIAHDQHVVRIDREERGAISQSVQKTIMQLAEKVIESIDAVILEDYNKGLLTPSLIEDVIALARSHDKKILVDPKFDHFFDYRAVTLFKPNKKEVADRLGICLNSDDDLEAAGINLLRQLNCDALLITLGADGMALFEKEQPWIKVPTKAVKAHDVSGAGDTVIASLAVSLTAGASLREAATIANHAAGIVCGEVGILPIVKEALFEDLIAQK